MPRIVHNQTIDIPLSLQFRSPLTDLATLAVGNHAQWVTRETTQHTDTYVARVKAWHDWTLAWLLEDLRALLHGNRRQRETREGLWRWLQYKIATFRVAKRDGLPALDLFDQVLEINITAVVVHVAHSVGLELPSPDPGPWRDLRAHQYSFWSARRRILGSLAAQSTHDGILDLRRSTSDSNEFEYPFLALHRVIGARNLKTPRVAEWLEHLNTIDHQALRRVLTAQEEAMFMRLSAGLAVAFETCSNRQKADNVTVEWSIEHIVSRLAGVNPYAQSELPNADIEADADEADRPHASPAWLDATWYRQPPMPPGFPSPQQISPYLMVYRSNLDRQSQYEDHPSAAVHELARISPRARSRYGISSKDWARRWHAM